MKKYRGVFPALYACFDSLGRIDPRRVRNMTRYLCESRVSGILVNGKPDAGPPLSVREKTAVMENVMAQAEGQVLVLCQVGCEDEDDSAALARRASDCGVDAAVVLHPGEAADLAETLDKWKRVAGAAGDTDMIFCCLPLPGNDAEEGMLTAFARETRMRGILLPGDALAGIPEYRRIFGEDVSLFSMRETELEKSVAMGADAVIGYLTALLPEICVRLESGIRFNALRHVTEDGAVMAALGKLMNGCSAPSAVAREVLKEARGVDCGCVRPPLREMSEADRLRAEECVRIIRAVL